jgi:hypothetical protein
MAEVQISPFDAPEALIDAAVSCIREAGEIVTRVGLSGIASELGSSERRLRGTSFVLSNTGHAPVLTAHVPD